MFPTRNIRIAVMHSTRRAYYLGSRMNFAMTVRAAVVRTCIYRWSRMMATIVWEGTTTAVGVQMILQLQSRVVIP